MKPYLTAICLFNTFSLFGSDIFSLQSGIVGYHSSSVSQGVSRVSIKSDALDIFPTLGDVIRFNPPDAIIGDTISFGLDGKWQCYRFESYDGTNAVLVTNANYLPQRITLNGIPLLDSYELNHTSPKVLTVSTHGSISAKYAREVGLRKPAQQTGITIEYISSADCKPHPLSH